MHDRMMRIERLVRRLQRTEVGPDLYNMFKDEACVHNLTVYLNAMARLGEMPPFVIGEAAGPHGCRLTGMAFTSENILFGSERQLLSQVGIRLGFGRRKDQANQPYETEWSATQVWNAAQAFPIPPVLWNTVPFHPHYVGAPLSIRNPRKPDRELGYPFLKELLEIFQPDELIPVGREAEKALKRMGIQNLGYVRHPSRGGATRFTAKMSVIAAGLRGA